ncbi:hypothetical protein [Schlesneria paludicola]|uniref:hypothetical protein n=1 Tax=Schlesneria paludicola TaxID=360056 RepID=UPI0002EAC521|nr:hypothetical protein [Schlesneria paludicola]
MPSHWRLCRRISTGPLIDHAVGTGPRDQYYFCIMPLPIRIDATTLPALLFGGLLVACAIVMGVFVWRSRRSLDEVVENDDSARLHADRQFRRRMQVSVMLGTIGLMIPIGDQLDQVFIRRPMLFFVWVGCVFVLVLWMVLMALGDWLSTFAYTAVARANLRHERRELEEEIRRYHASKNGHSVNHDDL